MRTGAVFAFAVLLSMIFMPGYFDHNVAIADEGDAPRILKQNALDSLAELDDLKKKDQKRIDKAIKKIEKSLDDKRWMDDSKLTLKGKKVFEHNKHAVNELQKVKSADVSAIISSLLESDRLLAQSEIDSVPTDSGLKKVDKQLSKANKEMSKAQKDLDKNKFSKAIDHYKKAWKLIALKGLDVIETDSGTVDIENDGLIDYHIKTINTGKSNKPLIVEFKIQDECVDLGPKDPIDVGGDTFDDAAMKIGVSTLDRVWLTEEPVVWNKWFKQNDADKKINLLSLPPVSFAPFDDDVLGDDAIQGVDDVGSFDYLSSISELDDRSGWDGSIFLNAPAGDYILWTIHPAGGYGECDGMSGVGVLISIP